MNCSKLRQVLAAPTTALAVALLATIVLTALPARLTAPLRDAVIVALRPGQIAVAAAGRQARQTVTSVQSHFRAAGRLAEAETELDRLSRENRRLAAELAVLRNQPPAAPQNDIDRLLLVDHVEANVLGRQARAFLARRHLLGVGTRDGVEPDAWVVDSPALLDRGKDAHIRLGQSVAHGRCLWGKIVALGAHTSVVQAVTEPGYRDLVQIESGPQGILEGTGEPLCRIRLVEVTAPVAVGDSVYTVAGRGVLPAPLVYGKIVRAERPVGAAHWDLWMQPAVTDIPQRAAVLRIELNPLRTVSKAAANPDD